MVCVMKTKLAVPLFRNSYEAENFFDAPDGDEPPQPAETSMRLEVRRKRKPNLDKLIAKAKAAGATSVVIEGVEMRFGEPGAAAPTSNPWDEVLSRDTH
jgi:hypothetical protein